MTTYWVVKHEGTYLGTVYWLYQIDEHWDDNKTRIIWKKTFNDKYYNSLDTLITDFDTIYKVIQEVKRDETKVLTNITFKMEWECCWWKETWCCKE